MSLPAQVAVVGSLNVDYTFRLAELPERGATLTARESLTCFGGKGANQALAAARAGAVVRLIGCVGADDPGTSYRRYLSEHSVDVQGVRLVGGGVPTGSAFICVEDSGENTIVVHPGANHLVTPELVASHAQLIATADALLLQLECPLAAVERAAHIAREARVPVILNPSPLPDEFLRRAVPIDVLIVNEVEAKKLVGEPPQELLDWPQSVLAATSAKTVLITRGGQSTLVASVGGDRFEVAPPVVTPVDTVGAGDTFAGAFAVAYAEGQTLREAVAFANTAGALATLQVGAQTAIPTRSAILARLRGSS